MQGYAQEYEWVCRGMHAFRCMHRGIKGHAQGCAGACRGMHWGIKGHAQGHAQGFAGVCSRGADAAGECLQGGECRREFASLLRAEKVCGGRKRSHLGCTPLRY